MGHHAKSWRQQNQNRHHLLNKCRGGDFSPQNIIMLKVDKHNEWHRIFRNSDPEDIIRVLLRMCRMKGYPLHENFELLLEKQKPQILEEGL